MYDEENLAIAAACTVIILSCAVVQLVTKRERKRCRKSISATNNYFNRDGMDPLSEELSQGQPTQSTVVAEEQPSCSGMVTEIKTETPDEFLQQIPELIDIKPIELMQPDTIKEEPLDLLPETTEEPAALLSIVKPKSSRKSQDHIVCRLCLKVADRNAITTLSEINLNYPNKSDQFKKKKLDEAQFVMKMLKVCVPLTDCSLTFNPVICSVCLSRLQNAYDFIDMCNTSQDTIEEYKNVHAVTEGVVNINDVIESKNQKPALPRQKSADGQPPLKRRKIHEEIEKDPLDTPELESMIEPNYNLDDLVDYPDTIKIEPEEETKLISSVGSDTFCANTGKSRPYLSASRDFNGLESSNLDLQGQSDNPSVPSRFGRDVSVSARPNLLLMSPTIQSCVGNVPNLQGDDDNP